MNIIELIPKYMKTTYKLFFILLIFFSFFNTTVAQTWNYEGKGAGKDIKFTLKIITDAKKPNFFYIGGGITKLDKGWLHIAIKDIKIPKNVKIITSGAKYKQWSKISKTIPHKQRLKFELLPGFKGGDIDLKIKCQYNETGDFKVKRLSPNGIYTFKIKNLPEILTADEKKKEAEINETKRLSEKAKNIETKYRDTINIIKADNTKIKEDLEALKKLIKNTDVSESEKFNTYYNELKKIEAKIDKNIESLQPIINKCGNDKTKEPVKKIYTEINNLKTDYKELKKSMESKELYKHTNIVKRWKNIKEKNKKEANILTVKYLPIYTKLKSSFETNITTCKELKEKFAKALISDNDTDVQSLYKQYDNFIKNFNKDSIKKKNTDSDYEKEKKHLIKKLEEVNKLKLECEQYINTLAKADGLIVELKRERNKLLEKIPAKNNTWIYILVGILIVLAISAYPIFNFLKKKKQKKDADKEKAIIDNIDIDIDFDENMIESGLIISLENINKGEYLEVLMSEQWNNSFVKKCYLHQTVIEKIYEVCREEQQKKGKGSKAPEMGGFLLGKYYMYENDLYDVYIDKYLQPSEVEHQDLYQIEFGSKAMLELDDALRNNLENALVGWFHTHPGHGPFLSMPDLNIHNGMFTKKWQLAIVTDPYRGLETGIFTRFQDVTTKSRTKINNKGQKKWFNWRDDFIKAKKVNVAETTKLQTNLPQTLEGNYYPIELSKFWINSNVMKIYIEYNLIFDLDKISISKKENNSERINFDGYIVGYYKEIESQKYNLYLNKISKEKPLKNNVAWIGSSKLKMNVLQGIIQTFHKNKSINKWDIAVVLSDNKDKISFFPTNKNGKLNFSSDEKHSMNFSELDNWTRK